MISTLVLKCLTCDSIITGKTENPDQKHQIRKSAVWGTIAAGETYAHTQEFLAHLDIPFIANNTFNADMQEMNDIVQKAASDSMNQAVEEEKSLTKRYDAKGVAVSRVILDGAWPVRSYGGRYKSRSGGGKQKQEFFIYVFNFEKSQKCFVIIVKILTN